MIFFKNMSIKSKLILSFSVVLLLPSLFVGALAYQTAKSEMTSSLFQSSEDSLRMTNEAIDQYLQSEMNNVEGLAKQMTSKAADEKNPRARELMDAFTSTHPELELLVLGNENGAWMKSPDPGAQKYDPRERDWYKDSMKAAGKIIVSDPYVSATSGNMVVSVAKMMPDKQGVVSVNLSLAALSKMVSSTKIGDNGYVYILDRKQKFLVHPTQKAGADAVGDHYPLFYKQESGRLDYKLGQDTKTAVFTTNATAGWKLVGTMVTQEIEQKSAPIYKVTLLVLTIAVIVGAGLIYWIVRNINRPLKRLIVSASALSQGDLRSQVEIQANDEIGKLGASFNEMVSSLKTMIEEISETSTLLAASSEQLSASAEQNAQATEQIATSAQEMSSGSLLLVDRISESSHVTDTMIDEVTQIAGLVQHTSGRADEARSFSEEGAHVLETAIRQMNVIGAKVEELDGIIQEQVNRSSSINQIIAHITEIANQINLLSLNASIEAARAGEHGKGFAVVAGEVKKLAEQTSRSSSEINELISQMQAISAQAVSSMKTASKEVGEGKEVVSRMGSLFGEIRNQIAAVSDQMQVASASSAKITEGTRQLGATIRTVSEVTESAAENTENISAAAQEQQASMEEISSSAQALSAMAEELQAKIERFKC